MAHRNLRFFMLPDELARFVSAQQEALATHVTLVRPGNPETIESMGPAGSLDMIDGNNAYWVCISELQPRKDQLTSPHVHPAEWGWVTIDVPYIQDNILYMGDLGAKSDWYDTERECIAENPASIRLFTKLARRLRRDVPHQAWGVGPTSQEPWPAKAYYSDAVRQWVRSGGQLGDRFAKRVKYILEPQ